MISIANFESMSKPISHGLPKIKIDMIQLVAIAMVITGLLYPFYDQYSVAQTMLSIGGYTGFYGWCLMNVACGLGILIKREWLLFWLLPIYLFVLVMSQISITAVLYYSSLLVLTLYQHMEKPPQVIRIMQRIKPYQAAGILHLLMASALILGPYLQLPQSTIGMSYIYNAIEPLLFGAIAPELFYQFLFLLTGLLLLYPDIREEWMLRILTSPFVIHGGTFLFVIVTDTNAWSLAPFFAVITILWVNLTGGER